MSSEAMLAARSATGVSSPPPMFGGALLLLCFLAVFVMARAWLYQVGERSVPLAAVLMAALMSTVPTVLCRVVQDLVLSTLLFAGIAILVTALLWRRGPNEPVVTVNRVGAPNWVRAVVVVSIGLATWAALAGHWWDESNCHNGVVTVLARGIVPPVHPLFPTEPFRYHYGFDVLAAQVRAFTGARANHAIDAAAILCFVLLVGMAREIGTKLAGPRAGHLAMILVPFGGGLLSLFFWRDAGPLVLRWDAIPARWLSLEVPPAVITNFYQHPQGFGMPIALGVLITMADEHPSKARLIVGAVLLAALSLANIVFFGVVGLMLGIVLLYRLARTRDLKGAVLMTGLLLAALATAYGLGGMLERGPEVERVMKFGAQFFRADASSIVLLHIVHFGVPFFAAIVALVIVWGRATALRVALVVGTVIGFAVPNVMVYARSWDIVKFYGVGAFFANVILAWLLADLLKRGSVGRRIAVGGLVIISVFTSYLWVVRMGALDGRFGIPKMHFAGPSIIGEATAKRLEPLLAQRDYIFSTNIDVGMAGGMLTPGFDWRVSGDSYMLDRKNTDRLLRHRRAARKHLRADDLAALEVKFLVLAPGDVASLSKEGRAALKDPNRLVHEFDVEAGGTTKHVYRVVGP